MGTGGAYRFAADTLRETVVVLNGDILTDIDISSLVDFHRARASSATIALATVEDPSAYGLVETDEEQHVLRFLEKPKREAVQTGSINTVNAGIYILEPSILKLIPQGEARSFEYDVFPAILDKKLPFFGYVMADTYWRDLGNPTSYLEAHHDFMDGRIGTFSIERDEAADVATVATIDKISVIGKGCVIKPGARIRRSVIGPGVHVDEKALIENSVIWPHTRISAAAEIRDAIIGRSGYIGRNVSVTAGTVLGDKASVPDYSRI
jgi:NDP-sugar pyrophosphorylase family protein